MRARAAPWEREMALRLRLCGVWLTLRGAPRRSTHMDLVDSTVTLNLAPYTLHPTL